MVLLATDVAARGLDVPEVDHVVHYQLPRSADIYIHRSGRTARAGKQGLSLQLCAPEEKPTQKALMKSLSKSLCYLQLFEEMLCLLMWSKAGTTLPELEMEYSLLTKLRERVELARQIEVAHHRADKAAHEENWLQQAAKEMDIDLDDEEHDSGGRGPLRKDLKAARGKEKQLRMTLKTMLTQPLMLRGISAKYLTAGGSSAFAKQMLSGLNHKTMLGLPQSTALEDTRCVKDR